MRCLSPFFRGPWRAAFFLLLAAQAEAAPATLAFEHVFSAAREPAALHYVAHYEDARGAHTLEVWRDGQTHLRRRTDAVMDVYVTRQKDGDLQLAVLDNARRIRTDVSRSSLYQLGQFSDWFGLSHSLNKPARAYSLRRLASPPTSQASLVPCVWYQLDAAPQHSAICWSTVHRVPVMITDLQGTVRWTLTQVDTQKPASHLFAVASEGYVRVNADQDIKAD